MDKFEQKQKIVTIDHPGLYSKGNKKAVNCQLDKLVYDKLCDLQANLLRRYARKTSLSDTLAYCVEFVDRHFYKAGYSDWVETQGQCQVDKYHDRG